MNNKAIIEKAVKIAQKQDQNRQWQKGDIVAHPEQPITMEIESIEGSTATIRWNGKSEKRPVKELFDPNKAKKIALDILVNANNN